MWLCAGKDVTGDSDIQQPAPPRPSRQRDAHSEETRTDGWISDVTARALVWINLGVHDGTDETGGIQGCGNGAGEADGV